MLSYLLEKALFIKISEIFKLLDILTLTEQSRQEIDDPLQGGNLYCRKVRQKVMVRSSVEVDY